MPFTIRSETNTSKCDGCIHAMHVQPKRDVSKITMCRMLGNFAIGPIKECSEFLPHIYAPIPSYMIANAWILQPDREGKRAGFKSPAMVKKENE